uniref:Protein kinase domain-containing protein n=1 Tax=Moniliophthora roreri TaxID=221103 RepID=A0A0W0GEJ5_MONRR
MGFTKRVVGRKKAREHDGEVFVEGAMNDEDSGSEEKEMYFSPLLLLEDCGDPIDPEKLNLDDRHECAALLFRFHHHGWTHGSFFPRNILMRRGDHADYPMERSEKDKRFRLIDFGRSRYLEDLAADDEKGRNEWDKTRFEEKSTVWHTMTLPNFT